MDLQTICRLCTKKNSKLISIYKSHNFREHKREICKVIKYCASVQVRRCDGFSERICRSCLQRLDQAYSFKTMCLNSEYKFRNNFLESDEIEIKSEHSDEESDSATIDNRIKKVDAIRTTNIGLIKHLKKGFANGAIDNSIEEVNDNRTTNIGLIQVKKEQVNVEIKTENEPDKGEDQLEVSSDDDVMIVELENNSENESLISAFPIPEHTEQANWASLRHAKTEKNQELEYKNFMDWYTTNKWKSFSENVFIAYFGQISNELPKLWGVFYMLKDKLININNIDIGSYKKLKGYLRRLQDEHKNKVAKILTANHIDQFINEAPDKKYLLMKVLIIIGIRANYWKPDLIKLKWTDIEDTGEKLFISIPDEQWVAQTLVVSGSYYKICKQFMEIRKEISNPDVTHFFLTYRNGKCHQQVISKGKFRQISKDIAAYLKLPKPGSYRVLKVDLI